MVWIFTASCSCVGRTPGEGAKLSLWRLQCCRECERNERIMDVLNESRDFFFKKDFICIL